MDTDQEVLEAARQRSAALASGDVGELRSLLHPEFRWFSHTGERFDRDSFVSTNTLDTLDTRAGDGDGAVALEREQLLEVQVVAHERTAVLHCQVVDTVDDGTGPELRQMPMTQVWVRDGDRWVCLAGHAGASPS